MNIKGKKSLKDLKVLLEDLILSETLKHHKIKFSLVNKLLTKKAVSEIIDIVYRYCGQKETVIFCDKIKDLGFKTCF